MRPVKKLSPTLLIANTTLTIASPIIIIVKSPNLSGKCVGWGGKFMWISPAVNGVKKSTSNAKTHNTKRAGAGTNAEINHINAAIPKPIL